MLISFCRREKKVENHKADLRQFSNGQIGFFDYMYILYY